jgi:uncharacterized protein
VSLTYHGMPRELFDMLASGGGGAPGAHALAAAEQSKHVILLRGILAEAQRMGGEQARLASSGYDLLAEVQRKDPAAAGTLIRNPAVGAWARHAILSSGGKDGDGGDGGDGATMVPAAMPGRLSAVAAAAAIRARLPVKAEVPLINGTVMLPTLGMATVGGQTETGTAVVRATPDGVDVSRNSQRVRLPDDPHLDAPCWLGLRRLRLGTLDVLIDDLDPFRMKASDNLAGRLSAPAASQFAAALRIAWRLLESHHPAAVGEIAGLVSTVVPYDVPPHGQVSASSRDNFGAIALSLSPDPVACAATLVHEAQHLKLCALLDIVTLTLPDDDQHYYAPWRPDPRPVSSLLQGAYAFLGVSAFWRHERRFASGSTRLRADTEFARWREAAAKGAGTLASSGRLTAAGQEFVRRMRFTLDSWQDEPVLHEALLRARREAERHEAQWKLDNGHVPEG